ncbi:MarR family winged helix-turn-helix transcriptional regulator [Mucilaginibacter sp. Mucisp86]|uniref:MarR family winged helix-turn-helix transcriptional regulator n=1 Tax=Mucilaginibacter sp. Mucisp86 TaxID=3243060 RepID=UPI0039B64D7F
MSTINQPLKLLMNLAKIQAVISRKFDGLTVHGIGFNDFLILHLLQQAPGGQLRRTELAEKIGLTASGITRLLLPMEKTGLVTRGANERDARVSYAKLTHAGKTIYEEALPSASAISEDIIPDEYLKKSPPVADLLLMLGGNIR